MPKEQKPNKPQKPQSPKQPSKSGTLKEMSQRNKSVEYDTISDRKPPKPKKGK